MKADISEIGCLVITPESCIEAYALKKWEPNYGFDTDPANESSIIIDYSKYPKAINNHKQ